MRCLTIQRCRVCDERESPVTGYSWTQETAPNYTLYSTHTAWSLTIYTHSLHHSLWFTHTSFYYHSGWLGHFFSQLNGKMGHKLREFTLFNNIHRPTLNISCNCNRTTAIIIIIIVYLFYNSKDPIFKKIYIIIINIINNTFIQNVIKKKQGYLITFIF